MLRHLDPVLELIVVQGQHSIQASSKRGPGHFIGMRGMGIVFQGRHNFCRAFNGNENVLAIVALGDHIIGGLQYYSRPLMAQQ